MNEDPALESSPAAPAPTADAATSDIERLFREHNSALLRFISAKMGSEQEAREIAQEAYVHLLQLNHPETVSYLRAFLFKTAANLAIDRLRQRGRRTHVTSMADVDFAVFELTPERQVSGEQALGVIRAAVTELPAKCRQAFLLHRVYGMPIDEIAGRMEIGACMVRRYIARGLEHIRSRLDSAGDGSYGRAQ
jgi:RNA polymerase sigma factor (sigma-70 family)